MNGRNYSWVWVICADYLCGHARAVPLAPWVIRWGVSDPTDLIRKNFRCSVCEKRGAVLQVPGYDHDTKSENVFPVGNDVRAGGREKVYPAWPDAERLMAQERARKALLQIGVRA